MNTKSKIQRKRVQASLQALKFPESVSPRLRDLINLVNLLPPGAGGKTERGGKRLLSPEYLRELAGEPESPDYDEDGPVSNYILTLPAELQERLYSERLKTLKWGEGLARIYADFWEAREGFGEIVALHRRTVRWGEWGAQTWVNFWDAHEKFRENNAKGKRTTLGLTLSARMVIDGDGVIEFVSTQFAEALEGADARRIRECEVCKRIFWTVRITQKCCTHDCANASRQRRWREKYETNYKLQRNGYKPHIEAKGKKK